MAIADLDWTAKAKALADELGAACIAVRTDVADGSSVEALFAAVTAAFSGVDIIVNNAGMGTTPAALETMDEARFERLMGVNTRSVFHTARCGVPAMKAARHGAILNIASTGGVSPRQAEPGSTHSKRLDDRLPRAPCSELELGAVRRAGERDQPRRRRDADAGHLHG